VSKIGYWDGSRLPRPQNEARETSGGEKGRQLGWMSRWRRTVLALAGVGTDPGKHQPRVGRRIPLSARDIFLTKCHCALSGIPLRNPLVAETRPQKAGGEAALDLAASSVPNFFSVLPLPTSSQVSFPPPPPRLLLSYKTGLQGSPFPLLTLSSSVD
jgi:hypothetical protein